VQFMYGSFKTKSLRSLARQGGYHITKLSLSALL
jgi:hypothetical protein